MVLEDKAGDPFETIKIALKGSENGSRSKGLNLGLGPKKWTNNFRGVSETCSAASKINFNGCLSLVSGLVDKKI